MVISSASTIFSQRFWNPFFNKKKPERDTCVNLIESDKLTQKVYPHPANIYILHIYIPNTTSKILYTFDSFDSAKCSKPEGEISATRSRRESKIPLCLCENTRVKKFNIASNDHGHT